MSISIKLPVANKPGVVNQMSGVSSATPDTPLAPPLDVKQIITPEFI
jgi:hypothetical protein